jgi:hypothetical protein
MPASAANVVVLRFPTCPGATMKPVPGAGRSTPTAFSSVARKTSWSALGNRCGSTRFVIEATPTLTSGSDARSCSAARLARTMRM